MVEQGVILLNRFFFHTRWAEPFDVSEWLVAWPTAFRLEVLRRVGIEALRE